MKGHFLTAAAVVFCVGCTHTQLRVSTLKQEKTLADLQLQQVLDNVARFVANPATLPYYALATSGSTQVSDNGSSNVGLGWDAFGITSETLGLGANRTLTEGWGLVPLNDPQRLDTMRCAYQWIVGGGSDSCVDCLTLLRSYYTDEEMACRLPLGWFCYGAKCDVPREACFVARQCDLYVWVMPGGMDGLARLSMTMLDIATRVPETHEIVRRYDRANLKDEFRHGDFGEVQSLEVTDRELLPRRARRFGVQGGADAAAAGQPDATPPPRRDIPLVNPAPQFFPQR